MDVEPVLSADHEVSADSQDALHEEDAAHVDVERPGEHLTPNISAMEKSAEENGNSKPSMNVFTTSPLVKIHDRLSWQDESVVDDIEARECLDDDGGGLGVNLLMG